MEVLERVKQHVEHVETHESARYHCNGIDAAYFRIDDVKALIAEVERLTCELETERIRLAGCGVAAMCNTEQSRREQSISKGSPYYSASYQDVLDAVAREIKLRAERDKYKAALEVADRRIRDVAARSGGPAWVDAKRMLQSDMELIHDGIHEALVKP